MTDDLHPKLAGVHPELIEKVKRMLYAASDLGCPIVVTSGVRTIAEQRALYAKGRSQPGPIVTNVDGIIKKSNHQVKSDGYGHAVDFAFLVDGRPSWEESHPWYLIGAMAKCQGLVWGGDWTTFPDRPHVELP